MVTEIRKMQVAIDDVKPFPGNARRGDLPTVRESVKTHGQYRSILVQESTGHIIAGNNTWQAMKDEGFINIDIEIIDVDDTTAKKINLMDNRANDLAGYDDQALADLLNDIPDFEGTGFERQDLDALMAGLTTYGGFGHGSASEKPDDPITQPGELIHMGDHRLMCGSCIDPAHLRHLMDGMLADLVVTSPPYNQELDSFKPSGMQKENPAWVQRMAGAYADSLPEPDYQDQQLQMFANVVEVCETDASFFYNHKIRYRDKYALSPREWIDRSLHWSVRQEIIWDRSSSITLNAKMFMPVDERVYWLIRGDKFHFNDKARIKAMGTIWRIAPHAEIAESAPFPVELPQRCIVACAPAHGIVLDPYAGTGTTMVAAMNTGRACYMMEIDPGYCDVIVKRWQDLTGGTPERIPPPDGLSFLETTPTEN